MIVADDLIDRPDAGRMWQRCRARTHHGAHPGGPAI